MEVPKLFHHLFSCILHQLLHYFPLVSRWDEKSESSHLSLLNIAAKYLILNIDTNE